MRDVLVPDCIPQRTTNMTVLLERNPIEVCDTVQELVECLQKVIVNNSRMNLYTAYFIGRAIDDALLSNKFPGMTAEKLGKALDLSRATSARYRKLAKILTPEEVDKLGHVPYRVILRLPAIEERFGEAAVKELKFRLETNDFEGARGTSAFDLIVADIAQRRLHFSDSLPGENDSEAQTETKEPLAIDMQDADVVDNAIDSDSSEESEGGNMLDALLAGRKKEARTKLQEEGRTKSERRQQAEIAFSQAKVNLTKLRDMYVRLRDDATDLFDKAIQQEDFIIGDDDINNKYRELLAATAAEHTRVLMLLLTLQKDFRDHGECLAEVETPDGRTPASLLDKQN